jgi:hypothetical protein
MKPIKQSNVIGVSLRNISQYHVSDHPCVRKSHCLTVLYLWKTLKSKKGQRLTIKSRKHNIDADVGMEDETEETNDENLESNPKEKKTVKVRSQKPLLPLQLKDNLP